MYGSSGSQQSLINLSCDITHNKIFFSISGFKTYTQISHSYKINKITNKMLTKLS